MERQRQYRDYEVGRQLLMLRMRSGLTQAELADCLGVHRRTIQNWETSVGYPSEQKLQRLIARHLIHGTFTPNKEYEEAEALWQQVGRGSPRPFALFDKNWFASLLDRNHTASTSLPQPETSAQEGLRGGLSQRLPHTLPRPLTSCIGREVEVSTIISHLADPDRRLVTLVGIGGIGKTRLALEVGWRLVDEQTSVRFPDGVFFVPLADFEATVHAGANAIDTFATAIADALRFGLSGAERPYLQVISYLRDQHILLILDTLEHLFDLTPALIEMLQQVPALSILATSRVRLDVRGEQVVALNGLAYPDTAELSDLIEAYPALQLFLRAASAHTPHRLWSADELAAAAAICTRLEGVPLALELASSQIRMLSIHEIAAELEAGSAMLHTSQRDVPLRHRSLEAVFDHSWHLLTPQEQVVVSALSVFRGGFDRHAALAVAGADLASLAALTNHSLLREVPASALTVRYSLHELVRGYVMNKHHAHSVEEQAAVAERHSHYYLTWASTCLPDLRGTRQQIAQAALHSEIENIRTAWRWAVTHRQIAQLGVAGRALFHFYEMRSWFREGVGFFRLAAESCDHLAKSGEDDEIAQIWAQMLAYQGWLTFHLGRHDTARELLERSRAILAPLDIPEARIFTLNYLAAVTYHGGGYAHAQALAHQALDIAERLSDGDGIAIAKTILGQIAYLTGAYSESQRWSLESLALERSLGNRWGSVFTLISLGRVAVAMGAYTDARSWFEEGLAIREGMGDTRGIGLCLTYLGDVAAALGEYDEAERRYRASLIHFRRIHNDAGVATALTKLGLTAMAGQDRQAAPLLLREALETACMIKSSPHILDVLAGLAKAFAEDVPERAAALASIVARHPAATQHSKQQASLVQQEIALGVVSIHIGDTDSALEQLVTQIMANPSHPRTLYGRDLETKAEAELV